MVVTSEDVFKAHEKKLEAEFDMFLLARASELYNGEQVEFTVQSEKEAEHLQTYYVSFFIRDYCCPEIKCCLENCNSTNTGLEHHYVTVEAIKK